VAGLKDAPRPDGPKTVLTDEVMCEILAAMVTPPPESLQAAEVTHWSSRPLAEWLRRAGGISVSHDSSLGPVTEVLPVAALGGGSRFSTDPQLVAKIRDVTGLYLEPPENAVVLCMDEESQIQAPDRTRSVRTMRLGIPERQTHDYVR
jgi:hypothetical protein